MQPGGYGQGPPPGGYGQQGQQQQQQPSSYGPQAFGPMGYQPSAYSVGRCPRCGSPHIDYPSFTWWGGLVGPKLLNHASCLSCSFGFNSKTGRSNTKAIAIYFGVIFGVVLLLFALRFML